MLDRPFRTYSNIEPHDLRFSDNDTWDTFLRPLPVIEFVPGPDTPSTGRECDAMCQARV